MPYTSMMDAQPLIALAQVVMIDVALAGDNAIVVGLAASRVTAAMRRRVIFWGIAGAVVLRVLFAVAATRLFEIIGLTLAGGIILLWVCWKMYRELRSGSDQQADAALASAPRPPASVSPMISKSRVAATANSTRSTTAPAMPQKITRRRIAAVTREAAKPTTIALSPASATSIITTWASAMSGWASIIEVYGIGRPRVRGAEGRLSPFRAELSHLAAGEPQSAPSPRCWGEGRGEGGQIFI